MKDIGAEMTPSPIPFTSFRVTRVISLFLDSPWV